MWLLFNCILNTSRNFGALLKGMFIRMAKMIIEWPFLSNNLFIRVNKVYFLYITFMRVSKIDFYLKMILVSKIHFF